MNQISTKKLSVLSLFMGPLVIIYYNLNLISLEIWFHQQIYNSYLIFICVLSLLTFLIGVSINIQSLKDNRWISGIYIFLLFNILIFITCLIFPLDERNSELSIYIAQTNAAWWFFMIGLGSFLRLLWNNAKTNSVRKLAIIISSILVGLAFYNVISLVKFIYLIHHWIFTTVFLCFIAYQSHTGSSDT